MNAARTAIELADRGGTEVELDCAAVDVTEAVDDALIGMLVTSARTLNAKVPRVALVGAPRPMDISRLELHPRYGFQSNSCDH